MTHKVHLYIITQNEVQVSVWYTHTLETINTQI